jgi:hypothetical protein
MSVPSRQANTKQRTASLAAPIRSPPFAGGFVALPAKGAGIALLVWMYLVSAIALMGCEFNAEYERSVVLPLPRHEP